MRTKGNHYHLSTQLNSFGRSHIITIRCIGLGCVFALTLHTTQIGSGLFSAQTEQQNKASPPPPTLHTPASIQLLYEIKRPLDWIGFWLQAILLLLMRICGTPSKCTYIRSNRPKPRTIVPPRSPTCHPAGGARTR